MASNLLSNVLIIYTLTFKVSVVITKYGENITFLLKTYHTKIIFYKPNNSVSVKYHMLSY